ncbi:hypothetical protein JXH92_003682 [Salmonella enterica subsp. enterica serovar 4,[5],12:b:-]|nr:hypothetical protein [Salmonella enterica subsp. enterica serovar 4,[5],12:b:-]
MADRQTLMNALRNADAAGDTEGAKRIAAMIQQQPEEAPAQGATSPAPQPEDKESMGYALSHPGEAFGALGKAIAGGVLGTRENADWEHPLAYLSPYHESDFNQEEKSNAIAANKAVGEALPMAAFAVASGGTSALMEGANIARPIVTRLVSTGLGSLAAQETESVQNGEGLTAPSAGQTASDLVINEALHGGGKLAGKLINKARSVLPSYLGGFSQDVKAANMANPEFVSKVNQEGNQTGQEVFQQGIRDENGNVILNPSQVFNPQSDFGKRAILNEQAELAANRGNFGSNLEAQQSGESLTRAVEGADNGNLQTAAQDTVSAFKQQSSDLYNQSKQGAQDILDSARIKSLKFPQTKTMINVGLMNNGRLKGNLYSSSTSKLLKDFNNAKITSIDDLDLWKQKLNEQYGVEQRAGNFQSSGALQQAVKSLKDEADKTLKAIDPQAASLYRDADKFYSESVGDFGSGNKSTLGKVAANENPDTAANPFVSTTNANAPYNAEQTLQAMQEAVNRGDLQGAQQLSQQIGEGLGSATRSRALERANSGENFSNTKFANQLAGNQRQAEAADAMIALNGADGGEAAANNALRDVVGAIRDRATAKPGFVSRLTSGVGASIGAGIGGTVSNGFGAAAGAKIGAELGNAVSGTNFLNRLIGTSDRANGWIEYLSNPQNAERVNQILIQRTGQGLNSAMPGAIGNVVDLLKAGVITSTHSGSQASQEAPQAPQNYNQTTSQPEPEQRAQSAQKPQEFNPRATRLYKALAHAETGGLDNRFIRTHAQDANSNSPSSAYGPAQITKGLAEGFYKQHSNLFNDEQTDYMKRFIQQGKQFLKADNHDPVYGYGGTGILTSKRDQQLYSQVARIMLDQMIKDNGGSLDKTVQAWRGKGVNDPHYFGKVLEAFKANR